MKSVSSLNHEHFTKFKENDTEAHLNTLHHIILLLLNVYGTIHMYYNVLNICTEQYICTTYFYICLNSNKTLKTHSRLLLLLLSSHFNWKSQMIICSKQIFFTQDAIFVCKSKKIIRTKLKFLHMIRYLSGFRFFLSWFCNVMSTYDIGCTHWFTHFQENCIVNNLEINKVFRKV